jgi:serine/threonine-protein kinase
VDAPTAAQDPAPPGGSGWLWGLGLVAVGLVVAVVLALTSAQAPSVRETTPPVASAPTPTPTATASATPVSTPSAPTQIAVPPLEGLDADAARRALANAGLSVGEMRATDSVRPGGTVLSSEPAVGASITRGGIVALTVASGSNVVPEIVGALEQPASDAVASAGLSPVVTTQASTAPTGTVIALQPGAGQSVPLGTSVSIVVAAPVPPPAPTQPPATPTPTPTRTPTPGPTT